MRTWKGLCLVLVLALLSRQTVSEDNDTQGGSAWEGVKLTEGRKMEDLLHWAIGTTQLCQNLIPHIIPAQNASDVARLLPKQGPGPNTSLAPAAVQ